jgi:hypothetical protein
MESTNVLRPKRQGNWTPGPGRPKGSKNARTKVLGEAMTIAAARLSELLPDVKTLDAHSLLIAIYSDPAMPIAIRLEAARAALRVEKPALQATQVSGELTLQAGIATRLAAARQRSAAITDDGSIIDAVVLDEQDADGG